MTECVLDGCSVSGIDLGVRKYKQDKEIYSGALSQDGKLVGISYGNNLLLISSETGKQYKMLTGHTDLVKEVFFSRDGQSVISIGDDRSIRIWSLKSLTSIVLKVPSKVGIKFNPEA
jgi:WD40 repeat protein